MTRVVTQSHLLNGVDELSYLGVDVFEEAGENFLHSCVEPFFVRRAGIPRRDGVGPRRQPGVFRDEAELLLILNGHFALAVPAMRPIRLLMWSCSITRLGSRPHDVRHGAMALPEIWNSVLEKIQR